MNHRHDARLLHAPERANVFFDIFELNAKAVELDEGVEATFAMQNALFIHMPRIARALRAISPESPGAHDSPVSGSQMRISVPGRGAPAGSGASLASSASPISQYVTATVDSVGPYVFATMACGKRSRSAAAVAWRNASPQKRKSFTLGSMLSENEGSTRHKSANEGVETHTDMSDFAKSANNERVSAVSSWETA